MNGLTLSMHRGQRAGRSAAALVLALAAAAAGASPNPPIAPEISDGSYTVAPQGCLDQLAGYQCEAQWVEERVEPDGHYAATSGSYAGKPEGAYSYRTADYYCDTYYYSCFTQYSASVTVVVTLDPPRIDSLEQQLRYRYRASIGDVVGDAGVDILLERVAGGEAGNGVIDAIILEQAASATFVPVVPSPVEAGSGAWSPAPFTIELADIDVDGFVDVVVRNIAATIPGALDQIVLSPGRILSSVPKGVRAFDEPLADFTANVLDYIVDGDYFVDNADTTIYEYSHWELYCTSPYGVFPDTEYPGFYEPCYTWSYSYYLLGPDYSEFSPTAVGIWRTEEAVADGSLSRSVAVAQIKSAVEGLLGAGIGGWDMGGIFDEPLTSEAVDERNGLDVFLAVLGIANAYGDEVDSDEAPSQIDRIPDNVYIVGRYVFGEGVNRLHTALYYEIPNAGVATWLSAFDSDRRTLFDGTLVAETSDRRDSPLLMRFTLGTVLPPSFVSAYSYFFGDLMSAHSHYRALPFDELVPYDAIPELPPCSWCRGRNSNGYVNGLIQATNGTPNIEPRSIYFDLSKLTGWEYPVEASYFGL